MASKIKRLLFGRTLHNEEMTGEKLPITGCPHFYPCWPGTSTCPATLQPGETG